MTECVQELLKLQDQQLGLFKEYQEQFHNLEREFHNWYTPLFDARLSITNLSRSGLGQIITNQKLSNSITINGTDAGVPNFWLRALKNNATVEDYITKKDEEALKYLREIQLEYLDNYKFKIMFEFGQTPFFSN